MKMIIYYIQDTLAEVKLHRYLWMESSGNPLHVPLQ